MDDSLSLSSYLVFNTVARNGNLSGAAKELLISQPAVSRSLARLEEGLSVKLFVRNSRGVRLTSEGALLYEHTRSAFDSLERAERTLKSITTHGSETIKLGVSTNLCKLLFTPKLKSIISGHPYLKLDICVKSSPELMASVESGELDLGLITLMPSVHRLEYRSVVAFNDIFTCSEEYLDTLEITGLPSASPKELIKKARLLLPVKTSRTGTLLSDFLEKAGFSPAYITEVDSLDSALDFAVSGLGIAVIPDIFASRFISDGTLIDLRIPISDAVHEAGLIFATTTGQRKSCMSLIDTITGEVLQ